MTRDVRACSPDDTMGEAAQVMWENDCGCVPVVDDTQRVVGVITDRDLAMAAHLQGVALRDSRVSSAMARDVKCCSPRDTPAMVQAVMQQYRIRRVPVIRSRLVACPCKRDCNACKQRAEFRSEE